MSVCQSVKDVLGQSQGDIPSPVTYLRAALCALVLVPAAVVGLFVERTVTRKR